MMKKKQLKPGAILFIGFMIILAMLFWFWVEDSIHNQQEALERTQYIESMQKWRTPGR